jgi:hypothetical protein
MAHAKLRDTKRIARANANVGTSAVNISAFSFAADDLDAADVANISVYQDRIIVYDVGQDPVGNIGMRANNATVSGNVNIRDLRFILSLDDTDQATPAVVTIVLSRF